MNKICAENSTHGCNLVGDTGTCPTHIWKQGRYNMPCPTHFIPFKFCIWRGFKNKCAYCYVLPEKLLNVTCYTQPSWCSNSLVWYRWFCYFINFSFDKIIFRIFQVSRDCKRFWTASVRHFTMCGVLLKRLFSWNNESFTVAHVRDHSAAMICFVQKCNWLCYNIGCQHGAILL